MLSIYNSGAENSTPCWGRCRGARGYGGGFWQDDGHHGVRQKRLANATENMKVPSGDKLTPALKKVYEAGAGEAFEWATKFVEEHPDVVAADLQG